MPHPVAETGRCINAGETIYNGRTDLFPSDSSPQVPRYNVSEPSTADVIVLGAGMVGVSTALHLQKRGLSVVLVDRRGAGEETSYGNTGIIQREGVVPYPFPRNVFLMAQYALNMRSEANLHWS